MVSYSAGHLNASGRDGRDGPSRHRFLRWTLIQLLLSTKHSGT